MIRRFCPNAPWLCFQTNGFFQQQAPKVNKKAFHLVAVMEQIPLIPSTLSNYAMLRFLNCSIKNVFHVKK